MVDIKLNEKQIDALKEVGTVGAGHAAIAMSQMLQAKINMAVVKVEVVPSVDLNKSIGGDDMLAAGVYIQTLGDLQGGLVMIFEEAHAIKLANLLLSKYGQKATMLTEASLSAIKEVCNIISGSYLSALSQLIPFKMAMSVPKFTIGQLGTILNGIFDEITQKKGESFGLVTEFVESTNQIKGYFLFLPKLESLDKILTGLEV
ncbi:MAG: chemotaxis protein CheC [bacterium]